MNGLFWKKNLKTLPLTNRDAQGPLLDFFSFQVPVKETWTKQKEESADTVKS